jgi:hypothetical protein
MRHAALEIFQPHGAAEISLATSVDRYARLTDIAVAKIFSLRAGTPGATLV